MKTAKRVFIIFLSLIMIFCCSVLGGCRKKITPIPRPIYYNRTQLYVSNYVGDLDDKWLINVKNRFEEAYKDYSFKNGKKGVQILIDNSNYNTGKAIITTISGSRNNVFFAKDAYYYEFVDKGLIADITDIVTQDLGLYGETGVTIEDKLLPQHKAFYKTTDNKYYAIPHYSTYNGIMYDVDLFETKKFYFAANESVDANTTPYNTDIDNGNNGFIFEKDDKKSNGPDGKPNTYDDGLPATYEEFFILCSCIAHSNHAPIIWSGEYRNDYIQNLCQALATDYEGKIQTELHYGFNATANNLVKSISDNGTVVFDIPKGIYSNNGYELSRSAGKYYALDFYQKLSSNPAFYLNKNYNITLSPKMAYEDFLFSSPEGFEPIAMICEDITWERRATSSFEDIAIEYGDEYSKHNRRIGIMPLPKATKDQIGKTFTVLDTANSLGFINANCDPDELALSKAFLQFCYTDVSLKDFTLTTSVPKALDYELTDNELSQMSYFGKSVWNVRENCDVVYPLSTNPFFMENQKALSYHNMFESVIGDKTYNSIADSLRGTNPDRISAKDYFNGIIAKYDSSWWNDTFGSWFNA